MSGKITKPLKNIILFVGNIHEGILNSIREFENSENKKFRLAVIFDPKTKSGKEMKLDHELDIVISCDMNSEDNIKKAILPYKDELLVATVRSERDVPYFQKIIPFIKDIVKVPSVRSLDYAISKFKLRKRLMSYDSDITPDFMAVGDTEKSTLDKIEKKIGFPLIIKPSGLANSALITSCSNREELEANLSNTFEKIKNIYKKVEGRGKYEVIVEQFLNGEMYSVDICVTDKGRIHFLPFVREIIGDEVGFNDFFTYKTLIPTKICAIDIKSGKSIVKKAIRAIDLKNSVAHIDMMKTKDGWKIIEIAARIGAFRRKIYKLSYGIDQSLNDILNKLSKKPLIPKKILGHSAVFSFFAQEEGRLDRIEGINKARKLKSFFTINTKKKIGEKCLFAKNGGTSVLTVKLFNKNKKALNKDVKILEEYVKIHTK